MAGGGVHGKVVGIARNIITRVGDIITMSRVFIMMSTRVGGGTTETVLGMDIAGIMNGYLLIDFNRTGKAGIITAIGKIKEPGASRAIVLDRNNKDRN